MTTTIHPDAQSVQLAWVDPASLRTRDQVRGDASPSDDLTQSVRTNGILQPPIVVWDEGEQAHFIVAGHRRVGAAIIAGLDTIPVLVRDQTFGDTLRHQVQLVENERRKQLTPAEVARGYADMQELVPRTVEDIAAAVGETPEKVAAGIKAVTHARTDQLLATRPAIDLEKAAILTEFEEHKKIFDDLADVAETRPEDFAWRVESARANVARKAREDELKAQIKDSGAKYAKVDGYGSLKGPQIRLTDLENGQGKPISPRGHAKCPGHVGFVSGYSLDSLKIEWACADPEEHGHTRRGGAPRELTEEEKREAAERDAQRERVEANRKARRQWIRDLLPGKINQLPGVYAYMAAGLLAPSTMYWHDFREPYLTLTLLGKASDAGEGDQVHADDLTRMSKTGEVAPFRLLLAAAFARHEYETARAAAAWQIRHFEQLTTWGYTLTEVDQEALTAAHAAIARKADEETADENGEDPDDEYDFDEEEMDE